MSMKTLNLTDGYLAERLDIEDISGFFATQVEIMPGTRALAFENGRSIGELAPGVYTLESFANKLMFWTRKNIMIVLLRGTDWSATYLSDQFLTQEGLRVEGEFEVRFSLENSGLFLKNLMGARTAYTVEDFTKDTYPLVMASLQESISRFSIRDLGTPETRKYMETAMENAIQESLSRYGIRFAELWISSLKHEAYDKLKEQKEELWMVRENETLKSEELEIRLEEIRQKERENDLDILADHVQMDREEGDLAVAKRRFDLKREMRRQIQSNEFDKITNQAEMEQFLFENDKAGLLREQERKELAAAIESEQDDRNLRREAVLKKLNLQLEQEIADFQRAYNHKMKLEALEQESELARQVETEENRKWLVHLEQERCERKEAFQRLSDQKEMDQAIAEITLEKEQSENRLAELRRERVKAEEQQRLELQKQREEWELELRKQKSGDQLERLEKVQLLNQAQNRADLEILEQKRRLESELKIAEESARQKLELEKIRIYTSFGDKGILALLGPEQAKAFAETFKNNNEDATIYKVRFEEQEKANSQAQALFREFMASQERNADRLVQIHTQTPTFPAQPVVLSGISTGMAGTPGVGNGRVLLCPQCRAEISESSKFCSNCGKQL